MGVPKFYRWISERYPCLSEVLKEYQIPEFDNLYLDMNGVVHVCSHPDDGNPHFRITEEKIFADIFHYIEVLFRLIKPKKVFFMAIDGVAPRAKMNQQRGRRFRSAREADDLEKKALEKGEILPSEARFDSNCITPGTEFMVKLHEQLKYFVASKVSTDKLWQGLRIYLSGHETPGEGEHKVMDFIRAEKSRPDFAPNTRHCLYGLDADLIMLGLASHEPHFSLLREEVRFGGKNQAKRSNAPEETTFHLLHLSLLREYLDFEFQELKTKLPFKYDIERIIDDWILMGFLVGNDFIPHLPHMHIHHECLPQLWSAYKQFLPTMDGYLHDNGVLNLPRFEKFVQAVAVNDYEKFSEVYSDLGWLQAKKGGGGYNPRNRRKKASLSSNDAGIPTANDFLPALLDADKGKESMDALFNAPLDFAESDDTSGYGNLGQEWQKDESFMKEFSKHKASYYTEKLQYPRITPDILHEFAVEYVRAIQWILLYYFQGVPSWNWFYPFHYAPYISDIRGFSHMTFEYDYATPFLPFQQLMAVLPAASKALLPKPYQLLMTSENSAIKAFYPAHFETDLNGKQQQWEAVVLIPFLEESLLVQTMDSVADLLTEEEKARNVHGPHLLFTHCEDLQPSLQCSIPGLLPRLTHNHCKCEELPIHTFVIKAEDLRPGLCPGVKQDVFFPGFPTLKHIAHTARTTKCGVKVFQMNSRGDNMILTISETQPPNLEHLAEKLLGQSIYVNWPHMMEARVVRLSSDEFRYELVKSSPKQTKVESTYAALSNDEAKVWYREMESIKDSYLNRKGVEVGQTHLIVHACPLIGRKYICSQQGLVTLEKQWSPLPVPYALQATVKDITVHDPTFKQFKSLDDLYAVGSEVFMLGMPFYGAIGKVLSLQTQKDIRIRVSFTEPFLLDLSSAYALEKQMSYMPGHAAANRVGISSLLLSRITGVMFVAKAQKSENRNQNAGRVNIALNLKFNKTNKEVPGFTRKNQTEWMYSARLVDVVRDYVEKFPRMFQYLARHDQDDTFTEDDIFNSSKDPNLKDVVAYLKQTPCANVEPMQHGSQLLDDSVVAEIERVVDLHKDSKRNSKKMQVRPHLLYKPLDASVNLMPDPSSTYSLFDRVINVREGYSVPLGLHGTVIGLVLAEKEQDTVYEVLFDEAFVGGLTLRSSNSRAYRVPPTSLINLSHGERKENKTTPQKQNRVLQQQDRRAGSSRQMKWGREDQPAHPGGQTSYHQLLKRHEAPKQLSSQPRKSNDQQNRQQQKLPPPSSDEFAMMWSQLQSGRPARSPAKPPPSAPSLSHAARSLPEGPTIPNTQRHGGTGRTRASQDPAPSRTKIDLQQMFEAAKKEKTPPTPVEVSDIEKMLQSASVQPVAVSSASMDSTAALCQILHIGEQATEPKEEEVRSNYGQKVSVEELFQGAQKKPAPIQQPQPQPQQLHQQMQHKSKVVELLEWCQVHGMRAPTYTHHHGAPQHRFQAVVTLASGISFQGSWTHDKEHASESAAAVALLQLKQQLPLHVMNSAQMRPGLSTSPNSAFTPVRSPGNNGAFMQGPPQFMPPNFNFNVPPPFQYRGPLPPHMPPGFMQTGSSPPRPVAPGEQSPEKNAFIPTQVLRKQRTPSKNGSAPAQEVTPERSNPSQPPCTQAPVVRTPPSKAARSNEDHKSTPKDQHKNSAGAKPSNSRRPKSRIAAKFGPN